MVRSTPQVSSVPRIDRAALESWHATVAHHLVANGLKAWEIALPSELASPRHEHGEPYFCYVVDGDFENRFGSRTMEFQRALGVYHPLGTIHSSHTRRRGSTIVTLEIDNVWIERTEALAALPSSPVPVDLAEGAWLMRRLRRELRHPVPCSALALEGLALELLAAATRVSSESGRPRWLGEALERLHDEPRAVRSVSALADQIGVAAPVLAREFRRLTGRTIGDYRRELQVERVIERLLEPSSREESLASIALDAGFADQAHCTNVFKRLTGTTPSRFRASALDAAAGWRRTMRPLSSH